MPIQVPWEADFAVGHALIDAQHQRLLALSNALAQYCGDGADAERSFGQAFDEIKALARAHFETESALLSAAAYPELEDHAFECDEFKYLADEIATAENFDPLELQRFLALWWLGHVKGAAAQSAFLAGQAASDG